MTRLDYDAIDAVNWSTLKLLARSPAHYRQALLAPREDTVALKLGRACHRAVFEPERFRAEVARWDGGVRRGKDWDVFCSEHKRQDILTEAEHDLCVQIGAAARSKAMARPYLEGGQGEVTIRWTHRAPAQGALPGYEIKCKGRVDFIAKAGAIVDLKTTTDASPDGFGRAAFRLLYHAQAAWYADGYERETGRRLPFVIVAVEKSPPFEVQVYRVNDDVLALGRELYRELLDRLNYCRRESEWPGYAEGELDLTLPAWASPQDEDIADMGLVINGGSNGRIAADAE